MILEGKVEVIVGQEKLKYETGAFTTFGKDFFIAEYAAESNGPKIYLNICLLIKT